MKKRIRDVNLNYDLESSADGFLEAKRKEIHAACKSILSNAKSENRNDLTTVETNDFDELDRHISAIDAELLGRQPKGRFFRPSTGNDNNPGFSDEYHKSFFNYLKTGVAPSVRNSLDIGGGNGGGYLVPESFETQLTRKLYQANVMRQLATITTITSGNHNIPILTDDGTAQWLDEGAAYTESDPTITRVTLGAHKMGRIMPVSEELLMDSSIDLESELAGFFGRSFGYLEEAAFVNGDGTGKPTGFLQNATLGKTGSSGTTISGPDEIFDLYYSLGRQYRPFASFIMHDSTSKVLRQFKTTTGEYIWQPGMQAGEPDRLLGRPVYYSKYMPQLGLSAKPIAFGDFSYYRICDRQNRTLQRLNELYAGNGRVGFRMTQRTDGKLLLPEAISVFQNAAS